MAIFLKNFTAALLTNANVAVYTPAATGISGNIRSASAYNSDTSDRTIDVYIVASGGAGAAAAGNQVYAALLIPAGKTVQLDALVNKNIIGAGSLVAKASVTTVVSLFVSGYEQTS
jgi:hypothetical protein